MRRKWEGSGGGEKRIDRSDGQGSGTKLASGELRELVVAPVAALLINASQRIKMLGGLECRAFSSSSDQEG